MGPRRHLHMQLKWAMEQAIRLQSALTSAVELAMRSAVRAARVDTIQASGTGNGLFRASGRQ